MTSTGIEGHFKVYFNLDLRSYGQLFVLILIVNQILLQAYLEKKIYKTYMITKSVDNIIKIYYKNFEKSQLENLKLVYFFTFTPFY